MKTNTTLEDVVIDLVMRSVEQGVW